MPREARARMTVRDALLDGLEEYGRFRACARRTQKAVTSTARIDVILEVVVTIQILLVTLVTQSYNTVL